MQRRQSEAQALETKTLILNETEINNIQPIWLNSSQLENDPHFTPLSLDVCTIAQLQNPHLEVRNTVTR